MCSYYKPSADDEPSLLELEKSLNILGDKSENTILSGDFNLPGWDWKGKHVKSDCNHRALHYKFGDILDDHNLVQMIEEPTRGKNTLDLIITNSPSKVISTEVIPGISDHCIATIEMDVTPVRRRQKLYTCTRKPSGTIWHMS